MEHGLPHSDAILRATSEWRCRLSIRGGWGRAVLESRMLASPLQRHQSQCRKGTDHLPRQGIEGMPSKGPRGSRSQQGFHWWTLEGGLLAEGTAYAGGLSVGPALDVRNPGRKEFALKTETPFKEQTSSETTKDLSQARAGDIPGLGTVCLKYVNTFLSSVARPYCQEPSTKPFLSSITIGGHTPLREVTQP